MLCYIAFRFLRTPVKSRYKFRCHSKSYITQTTNTKAKPVGHGYVFSMAVGTIGEWLKLVPFLLWEEQLILKGGGGGWQFSKMNPGRHPASIRFK